MSTARIKSARHSSSARTEGRSSAREIAVDEVIENLIDLFDHLGINRSLLAARIAGSDPKTIPSRSPNPHPSAIGEILTAWHQDSDYLDERGCPLPIKMRGVRRSFCQLADKTVPYMDTKILLAELKRIGAVTIDARGDIRVTMRSLPVYKDKQLATQHTLVSLDSFIKTLRHNLNSEVSNSDQLFHRVAWSGDFDAREIPALKIRVKRHGQNFLESCDNWMTRKVKLPLKGKKKRAQVFVGVYLSVDEI